MTKSKKDLKTKLREKSKLRNNKIRIMLSHYKSKITRLRLRRDTKRPNMISNKEIFSNKNIGLNIHYKISKKSNKNINKIYKRKSRNLKKSKKDKRQSGIK